MSGGGRQDPRGAGGAPPADGDDLVALVYGELDGDEERTVRARVAADPALARKLSEMEQVRSLFGSLADEEPAPRLSAQLLAQAAQSARPVGGRREAAAARSADAEPGLWARLRSWMQPIIAHPGLAAAASIVLLAGVAGLLVARKGTDLGPREHAEAPATAPVAGGADGIAADQPGGAPGASAAAAPEPTTALAPQEQPAALDDGELAREGDLAKRGEEAQKDSVVASKTPRRRVSSSEERANRSAPADATKQDEDVGSAALGLREGGAASGRTAPADRDAPASSDDSKQLESAGESGSGGGSGGATKKPEPVAPAASPPAVPSPSSPPRGKAGQAPSNTSSQSAPASAATLHKRALSAAASRRCLEVQSLDRTIRALDPAYHEKVFRPDRRLATCLSAAKRSK